MTRSAALPPPRLAATFFVAALSSLLLCSPARAQAPTPPAPARTAVGMDIFRKTLQILQFKPLKSFNELDPKDCILIVFGDTHRLIDVPGGLKHFLEEGGAALIASDQPMQIGPKAVLTDAAGVFITGYSWSQSTDLSVCYRQIDFCPYIESKDERFMRDPKDRHWLKVATNLPTVLERPKLTLGASGFARLPLTTRFWAPKSIPGDSHDPLFGVADDIDKGRIIVLGDHSIFINEMMKPRDTGNVEFTANCLTYLRGNHGERKRVLFVDDGVIQPSFEAKLPKPSPIDMANALLGRAQDKVNDIEERDGFNRPLTNYLNAHPGFWVTLLVLATLVLLIYGCYRLGIRLRYQAEPGVPPLARVTSLQEPRGSLLQLRHEGLLDAANVWETGRQLARDAFEAGGVVAPLPYREPVVQLPKVAWWRRSPMRRRVLHLWRLAFLNRPTPLAPHGLRALAAELEQLKVELKRGSIQLT